MNDDIKQAIEELKKAYPKTCKTVDYRLKGGFDDHKAPLGKAIDKAIYALEVLSRIEYLIENSGDENTQPRRKKVTTISLESLEELIE